MTFVYAPPAEPYLNILHVDDHIIVVNKPSGLLSVPGSIPAHKDSVVHRLSHVYPSVTAVHRLDMATSGVIVLARTLAAHKHLSYQFENRHTKKRYYARLFGTPEQGTGIVDVPLIVDYPNRPKQKVDWEHGKQAITCYRQVAADNHGALMELHPITGRSHQLRMHMLELGCPILGDRLYSPPQSIAAVDRLQLHAQCLEIVHPLTGKRTQFSAPIPFSSYQPAALQETYNITKDLFTKTDKIVSN